MSTRVIVVDDEPIAAESVVFMIKNHFPNIEVSGVFHSGREAVRNAALLRPNIIVMDIEMPGINGLEAMRQIRAQNPQVSFLILSAYDKFRYAVDAFSLGASYYLLKPVKQREFTTSFLKVLEDLNAREREMENILEQQERIELIQPLLANDFVRAMLPDADMDDRLIACAGFLGYLNSEGYVAIVEENLSPPPGVLPIFLHQLKLSHSCEAAMIRNGQAAVFFALESAAGQREHLSLLAAWSQMFSAKIPADQNSLLIGAGNRYKGALQMKESCREAFLSIQVLREEKKALMGICFLHIARAMKSPAFKPYNVPFDTPDTLAQADQIVAWANLYMEAHYADEIVLEDVARHVNLSPYYFSRFYKEHTGINYIDKLVLIRMEKAKKLLRQHAHSIKDVAYSVGYNDPSYFSKVFKKETGVTASEYKAMFHE